MTVTVSAKLVEYAGTKICRVGPIYAGGICGKRAEVTTVVTGSNEYRYESAPRCRVDAIELLGDPALYESIDYGA